MRTALLIATIAVFALLLPCAAYAQAPVQGSTEPEVLSGPLATWPPPSDPQRMPPAPLLGARAADPNAPPSLEAAAALAASGDSSWQRWPFGSPDQTGGYLSDVKWVPADPATGPAEAWAVGFDLATYDGLALHWNGETWARTPLPPDVGMVSRLALLAPNDVWAAGETFLHWDGTAWTVGGALTPGLADTVMALQMISPTLGFAGTFQGYLYTYDGTGWTRGAKISPIDIRAIHMFDARNGWASGQQGVILRCQDGKWSQVYSPVAHALFGMSFVSPTDGWIVGWGRTFLHWDGSSWTPAVVPEGTNMYGVAMRTAADGWAAGTQGALFHWDGQSWSRSPANGQEGTLFTMVAPASSANVLAVGSGGTLLRWDGRSWTPIPLMVRPPAFFTDVGMVDAQLGWAVGRAGKIFRWDGHDWVEQPPLENENSIYSIHVNDAGLTFLSGAYILGSGDNSGDWVLQEVPEFMVSVDSVAATSTAYAAGQTTENESHAVIYRKRPGEDWGAMTVPQVPRLEGIRMFDDSYGIAVGAQGTILRWTDQDGAWIAETSPTTEELYSVEFVARDDWWIVGAHGTILHGDGESWAQVTSPLPDFLLRRVRATGSTVALGAAGAAAWELWICGDGGGLLHWNKLAHQWDVVPSSTVNHINSLVGPTAGGADAGTWAVGEYGTILRYVPTYTIRGTVTIAPGGEGVAGIEVRAMTPFGTGAGVRTDVGGAYTLTGVLAGTYTVTLPSSGYIVQPPYQMVNAPPSAQSVDFNVSRANSWVCWPRETPLSCVPDLLAVASAGDGTAWAVGMAGAIYFWDGSRWLRSASPTGQNLNGLAVRAPDDVWAVGLEGTVLHFDGHSWQQLTTGDDTDLGAVAALAADDVWVVGLGGKILHWNGTTWQTVPSGTQDVLRGIAMLSPNNGWAVGGTATSTQLSSTILHWDGTSWKVFPSPVELPVTAVVMLSPTLGWAASGQGLLRWNGSFWAIDPTAARTSYSALALRSPGDGWAIGYPDGKQALFHWDGTTWTPTLLPDWSRLLGVANTGDGKGVIVGYNGLTGHKSPGAGWALQAPELGEAAISVDAAADGEPWLAAMGGVIWRWNGTTWVEQGDSNAYLANFIKVYGPDNAWVGGIEGFVGHWDGTQWVNRGEKTDKVIYNIQQLGPNDVWAAGGMFANEGGELVPYPELMHWNGTAWTRPDLGSPRTLFRSMAVFGPADIWASGYGGFMFHYDGQAWTNYAIDTESYILSLAGKAANDIWGVGTQGKIVHWDGASWHDAASPTEKQLGDLAVLPDGTGWAVGDDMVRLDGEQWQLVRKPTGKLLTSLVLISDHDGWAVGDNGIKLRLGPAYTAQGTVRDPSGDPLYGVAFAGSQGDVVFSDMDGTYVFDDLSAGPVTITPVRKGWVFDPPSRTITPLSVAATLDFVGRPYAPLFMPMMAK